MTAARVLFVLVAPLILTACFGKVQLAVERRIEPAVLVPSATLTETVRLRIEPPPGASAVPDVERSALGGNLTGGGWSLTDESRGGIVDMRASRVLSGDRIFTINEDPGLARFAIRVTDLFVVRRYEVKVAVPGTGEAAGRANDPVSAALQAMLLEAISYEQVLVMPGSITAHDFPKAEGSRLSWKVDLRDPDGRVLRAESVYIDPAASAVSFIAAAALIGGLAVAVRRRGRPPVVPAAPLT